MSPRPEEERELLMRLVESHAVRVMDSLQALKLLNAGLAVWSKSGLTITSQGLAVARVMIGERAA